MFDNVAHRPQCPLVLITRRYGAAPLATARPLGEEHRNLGAELGELKWAGQERDSRSCGSASGAEAAYRVYIWVRAGLVDVAKDIEVKVPLDPGRVDVFGALVDGEGYGSNECDTGHRSRHAWCRLSAQIHLQPPLLPEFAMKHTSKETGQLLGAVRMPDTVQEPAVLVGLHAGLDTVEGKGGEGGEDAGCAGGDFGAVALDEGCVGAAAGGTPLLAAIVGSVAPSGSGVERWAHDGWGDEARRDMLVTSDLALSGHAAIGAWPAEEDGDPRVADERLRLRPPARPESRARSQHGQSPGAEGPSRTLAKQGLDFRREEMKEVGKGGTGRQTVTTHGDWR